MALAEFAFSECSCFTFVSFSDIIQTFRYVSVYSLHCWCVSEESVLKRDVKVLGDDVQLESAPWPVSFHFINFY